MGTYDDYYSQLAEQNSGLGDYAVNATNQALRSNPNVSEFIRNKSNYGLYSPEQNSITTDPKSFLGLDKDTWGGLAAGGQLLGGLAGTMLAFDARDIARDTLNYNKMAGDRAYAMAKDAYDRNVNRANFISNQMNRNATVVGQA
jgi:hypothetical protein